MKAIIFTDGSSRGNPGPGGWGAIVVEGETVTELGGRESKTTNNRMELTAVVEALKHTKADEVIVHTDSSYLISGITSWIEGWKKNNWKTKTKDDVLNRDLWETLDEVINTREVLFRKVSGHAGVPANERCDVIATSYADNDSVKLYHGVRDHYGKIIGVFKTYTHFFCGGLAGTVRIGAIVSIVLFVGNTGWRNAIYFVGAEIYKSF